MVEFEEDIEALKDQASSEDESGSGSGSSDSESLEEAPKGK